MEEDVRPPEMSETPEQKLVEALRGDGKPNVFVMLDTAESTDDGGIVRMLIVNGRIVASGGHESLASIFGKHLQGGDVYQEGSIKGGVWKTSSEMTGEAYKEMKASIARYDAGL